MKDLNGLFLKEKKEIWKKGHLECERNLFNARKKNLYVHSAASSQITAQFAKIQITPAEILIFQSVFLNKDIHKTAGYSSKDFCLYFQVITCYKCIAFWGNPNGKCKTRTNLLKHLVMPE